VVGALHALPAGGVHGASDSGATVDASGGKSVKCSNHF